MVECQRQAENLSDLDLSLSDPRLVGVAASGAWIACPTSGESIITQCGASLWALINVLDIGLDGKDAVSGIGVGAEEFGGLLSLAK